MKKLGKFLNILIVFLVAGGTIFFVGRKIATDLGIIDSDALFGGQLEQGYQSAGYLISYEPSGGFKTCGYSAINNRIAVTASHCVDNSQTIQIGRGEFNLNPAANISVTRAVQKDGWVNGKNRRDDFAILVFNDTQTVLREFATITAPQEGCNYRVVAYGRTEKDGELGALERPRKSAQVCISQIDRDIFTIKGANNRSGICFGDSGSPIYANETNQVVGVVASIILEKPEGEDPCDFGNTAIGVRTDNNLRLINENIEGLNTNIPNQVQLTDAIIIDVAQDNLLDQIGLGNLTQTQQSQLIILIASSVAAFLFIILLFLLLRKPKHQQTTYYY